MYLTLLLHMHMYLHAPPASQPATQATLGEFIFVPNGTYPGGGEEGREWETILEQAKYQVW